MNRGKSYFRNARAAASQKFVGVDGFNNFVDQFSTDYNATGTNIHQQQAATSLPYEVEVENANGATTDAFIFGSYIARTAGNFNNPAGVTVSSITAGVSYEQLLAQSEHKNFECGMVYIQAVSGSNSVITSTFSLTTGDANGTFETKPLVIKKDPMQQQDDVLEFYCTFKINGFTSITVPIPANTTVHYSFYSSATVDSGRHLGNVPVTLAYKGPRIGKPMEISTGSLAALKNAMRG